jgi:hypothetical protein
MAAKVTTAIHSVWRFYVDGFKQMTWGRELWVLIIVKLILLFAIMRVFFFKPAMAGMTDQQKTEMVGDALTGKTNPAEGRPVTFKR